MERVINHIANHSTKKEPITNKEIGSALNMGEFEVRKKINEARCQGFPICSCNKGYYYSNDKSDILETIQSLMHYGDVTKMGGVVWQDIKTMQR